MPTGGRIDLTGRNFGRLTVIKYSHTENRKNSNRAMWECLCECGNSIITRASNLTLNHTKSCGCYNKDGSTKFNRSHGKTNTVEYRAYIAMLARCYNPKCQSYKYYGARGITVCKQWRESFFYFLNDVGLRPSDNHSLERKKVNGNYTKANVKWGTLEEQANNKRTNKWFTYEGVKYTQSQLARLLGANKHCFIQMLKIKTVSETINYYITKQKNANNLPR